MALTKLQFRPGVNREGTNYSGEGGWYACDKIRFRSGFPEKLGGWGRAATGTFLGVCRSMWNWVTLASNNLISLGTSLKYYIYASGTFNDVTPLRMFTNTAGTYAQVASTTLTVTLVAHGIGDGSTVSLWFTSGTATSGQFVITVTGVDTFTVTTTSGTSSGAVTVRYNTVALTNPFTTTNGSAVVTVTDAAHGALTGDYVTFAGATGFNNIPAAELNAEHQVTYVGANTYTITVTTAANAGSSGGGATTAQYQINVGLANFVPGLGWGSGPWNSASTSWGQSATQGAGGQLRIWTNDNFGQNLLACVRGGAMYYWTVSGSTYTFTRMQYLADASFASGAAGQFVPSQVFEALSSSTERIVVAFGANSYDPADPATAFDPMLVRWSDQENVFDWVPTATNQAGEQRLTHGSLIISACVTRQETLIWTDVALYSQQYLGPPYTYGFTLLAGNISCMSPQATVAGAGAVYWMGVDKFYRYSGRAETLPCTLWRHVFRNINLSQAFKVIAGSNEAYNEVWWMYPSANSTENDSYVIYNYVEDTWVYGSLVRTAWLDSPLQQYPLATNASGTMLYHEYGVDDDETGTPAGMTAYIQSSDFDIGDGNNFMFLWRAIPDVTFDGSTDGVAPEATMSLYPRQFPGAAYGTPATPAVTGATYPLTTYTEQVMTRLRARQMSFRIGSSGVGTNWQLGVVRIDARPDGRKS